MRINTHLFLVNEDLIPNITPVLDDRFRPESVYLLSSPATFKQAERLKKILKQSGVEVHDWAIDDPWDIEHIRDRVFEFLEGRNYGDVAVNVTSGTKPMSLAAYDAFQYAKKPVYCVHPENDHVIWMSPRDLAPFDLADRIKLPLFFKAHDLHITSSINNGIPKNIRELNTTLAKEVKRFSGPLTVLNALAASAVETLLSTPMPAHYFENSEMREMLDLFCTEKLFEVDPEFRLRFPDESARFFVNGGWLEEHVYSLLFNLRKEVPTIQDVARNIRFLWDEVGNPKEDVENEIDVAFLADNRLYLIECKTKKYDNDANDVLYKLGILRDNLGGREARAMFISYQKLTDKTRRRAAELNIQVYELAEIKRLEETLKCWIQKFGGCKRVCVVRRETGKE